MSDSEDDVAQEAPAAPIGVGPQLRAAREEKGLTIDQLASQTRIARRNLEHIEAGNFGNLPGRTYAIGFAKTYAKSVDLDQDDVADLVRAEMDAATLELDDELDHRGKFEPGDPNRAPGGGLLWFSLIAAVVFLVGIFFAARALFFSPEAELPSLVEQQEADEAEAAATDQANGAETAEPVDAAGAVVFTAEGETWVRFYTEDGTVLQEGTMAQGDSFTVPANADNPMIITGRPDLLAITIGGQAVRKLGTGVETLQDVPISAEALLARSAAPAPASTSAPAGGPTVGFGFAAAIPDAPAANELPIRRLTSPVAQPSEASEEELAEEAEEQGEVGAEAGNGAETTVEEAIEEVIEEVTPEPAATAPPQALPADPPADSPEASPETN